jgi:hypothetical protein
VSAAPGVSVPRHTHTREDESYYVLSGELKVVVGEKAFVLKAGDTLMAPRDIPHQLRNPGSTENHFLLIFSPSGFEEFVMATAIPAPDNAALQPNGNFRPGTLQLPFRRSISSPPSMEFSSVYRHGFRPVANNWSCCRKWDKSD